MHDVINNIVMCASSKEVKDVFINGREVLRDDQLVTLDETKIISEGTATVTQIFNQAGFTDRVQSGEFI
jgi:5-methylthioadenosine/S-adenosylhomocysteine deaminase